MYSNENGTDILFNEDSHLRCRYVDGVSSGYPDDLIVYCRPTSVTVNKQTTITINNNTWNGNIYTDNSTNLTYIYPQYTTINEKNETVTNISTTPIIYNNETKQYYTYDQTTKNYAYGSSDTIYIQMSGTGCRTWETTHPGLTWEKWIQYLQSTYASLHISRLDIACDTFGKLKLKTVQAYTRAGRYISRWKTFLIQEGSAEMAVIWGSSKSDFRLRIYDKTLERQVKGSVGTDKIPKDWVRCEFQLRNDAAASFIRSWQSNGSIGLTFMGIMKNQLLYVSQYDGKNRDRATVAPWWARLLGDAEQIRMAYDAGKDYNFDSLKRYIFHQAGSSIKAYLAIMDGDFCPLLQGVRMAALNDRQTELIRSAQKQRREWQQRQIEYNKM